MESLFSSKTQSPAPYGTGQSWLPWFLRGCLLLGFLFLLGRLVELQVIKGSYFHGLAEGNRIRRVPITAPRGKILARGGEVLAGSKKVKKRVVFDPESGYEKIDDLTGATEDEIITEWIRYYELDADFAHLNGYLGEVSEQEVGKVNPGCVEKGPRKLGSWVGRTGLEEEYECRLSGIDGEELVEVDSGGNKIRLLGRRDPIAGEDIRTSIHYGLQKMVAEVMNGERGSPRGPATDGTLRGAIVATDIKGEVLALYSSPSYNPNIFIEKKSGEIQKVLKSRDLPLFNRVIGGSFHPGSVFKPVVAIAALEEGEIDEGFTYEDTGQIIIETIYGTFSYTNWYFTQYGATEGKIDVKRAMARSTDTFFYKIGELVGIRKLNEWAHKFGLGELSQIDIPGEVVGLIPSPEWKEEVKGERWFLGNTYHLSIGQGDIALTPLGVNQAIAAIAANGVYCTPHLATSGVLGNDKLARRSLGEGGCKDLGISKNTIKLVKEGMKGACSPGGTGFTFFDFEIPTACKTGTAETIEEGKTHAWFVAFAPVDFPEIVATVLVEKGGEGSYVAGPIAREIFEYWFTRGN